MQLNQEGKTCQQIQRSSSSYQAGTRLPTFALYNT
jgi:hypothetical protein